MSYPFGVGDKYVPKVIMPLLRKSRMFRLTGPLPLSEVQSQTHYWMERGKDIAGIFKLFLSLFFCLVSVSQYVFYLNSEFCSLLLPLGKRHSVKLFCLPLLFLQSLLFLFIFSLICFSTYFNTQISRIWCCCLNCFFLDFCNSILLFSSWLNSCSFWSLGQ